MLHFFYRLGNEYIFVCSQIKYPSILAGRDFERTKNDILDVTSVASLRIALHRKLISELWSVTCHMVHTMPPDTSDHAPP